MRFALKTIHLGMIVLVVLHAPVWAVSCEVPAPHTVSEAQSAFLHNKYEEAVALYRKALEGNPSDADLTVGLVDVLLKQEKVLEASNLIQKAVAQNPKSAALLTALGFVQYREGTPRLATQTANEASLLDPCYPRIHFLNLQILRLNSMFKSAAAQLKTAHVLDPADPQIRRQWLRTLPLEQRIAEACLASANGDDQDEVRRMHPYLYGLKKSASQPHKSCQLASSNASTQIPFASLLYDANHLRAYGLDVKLNDHTARLEIDTGASGLVISRSVAKSAGLEAFSQTEMGGIGNGPAKAGYSAYVDSIKIGSLEFHDCEVAVFDSRSVIGVDGLIGMEVFSNLLVTLDYPMRKLELGPLPARPQDVPNVKPTLERSQTDDSDANEGVEHKVVAGPQNRYVAPRCRIGRKSIVSVTT